MVKVPINFKRFAAAFDEIPIVKSCDSSGSDHSADLSDLVNSFLERETREERNDPDDVSDDDEVRSNSLDFESRDGLKNLLSHEENDAVIRSIREEVEKAYEGGGGYLTSSPDFKRRLMARLRNRGFDAGICKSKWEKDSRCLPGSYEYIDVEASGVRYIVEILLAGEFTIARPSGGYASLLHLFPEIYVGRAEELKQVVRIMCSAIRRSMKKAGIHVPPWRRRTYMQSKWFGSYKRTTNEIPRLQMHRLPVPLPPITLSFKEDFAAVFKRKELIL